MIRLIGNALIKLWLLFQNKDVQRDAGMK